MAREKDSIEKSPSGIGDGLQSEDPVKLIEDLRLHQVELQMQNEELRRAQEVIEESRERLADLYDYAPVAYLTIDGKGIIQEANLTASALFEVPRHELIGAPFNLYVDRESQDEYFRHRSHGNERKRRRRCARFS